MSEHGGPDGDVTVALAGEPPCTARAVLAARFDPLAGHVVWTGRVAVELPLRASLVITTPHGRARAEATEHDVWGNTRVTGSDRPPFPVEVLDGADLDR
jgi:hypothetical protein